jgi:hypothetical protein
MAIINAAPEGSFGQTIGKSVGGALGSGLNALIEKKINDLHERQGIERAQETLKKANLPEWLGDVWAKDPATFREFIKQYDFLPPEAQNKVRDTLDNIGLENEGPLEGQQQESGMMPFQQTPIEQRNQPMRHNILPSLTGALEESGFERPEALRQHAVPEPNPLGLREPAEDYGPREQKIPGLNSLVKAGEGFQPEPGQYANKQSFPELGHGTKGQPGPFESSQTEPLTGWADKSGFRLQRKGKPALSINPEIEQEKLKRESYKETKGERETFLNDYRAAKRDISDFERMEELEKEGKLDTPGYLEFLQRSGLDIPALMNPGTEEFNKIAANFLRDAKAYYGGRVTNYEMEQFLKTIPNLSQSPEGRKRVIANLKNLARAKTERYQAYKDIKQHNKGVIPVDIGEQVEDRIDTRMDHLAAQFKKDLAKKVPEGQNKFVTALQSALGSAIPAVGSAIGSAAKGAAKGAIGGAVTGALGGPIGAGSGALLGGLGGLTGII